MGDIFVVTAQLAAATQFIIEEKYLTAYRVPALLAVGLEGMWGLAISAVALPSLSFLRWPDGTPVDVLAAAVKVRPAPEFPARSPCSDQQQSGPGWVWQVPCLQNAHALGVVQAS